MAMPFFSREHEILNYGIMGYPGTKFSENHIEGIGWVCFGLFAEK